jgi:hypothetical protein
MRDAIRWIAYSLLALGVLFLVLIAGYRLRGPTSEQRAALALMHANGSSKEGTNAFSLLWYMQYDVPNAEMDARLAVEIAEVKRRIDAAEMPITHGPSARKLDEAGGAASRLCAERAIGCLAQAGAGPQAMRDALATYPVMRSRESAFEKTAFFQDDFPANFRVLASSDPGAAQRIWLSGFALQYVDGDRTGALSGVCRNIDTWRRLRGASNTPIASVYAINGADGGMRLFAEMLAELPADVEVPRDCFMALRPVEAADADRCAAMTREFALSESMFRDTTTTHAREPWWSRAWNWIFFDATQTNAWWAERHAAYCDGSAARRLLADIPLGENATPIRHRPECIASLTGCILADIAAPSVDYGDGRVLDFLAHLRLAATLLAMRESGSDASIAVRFEDESDSKRSRRRNSGFDRESGVLFVDDLDANRGARFELPVPRRSR